MNHCTHCGASLDGAINFCKNCGEKLAKGKPLALSVKTPVAGPADRKKLAIIIGAGIAVLALILVLVFTVFLNKPETEQPLTAAELLDLGEKYLLDMDYEQALVQFMAVIEIEPKNERGYTGAAEAYIGLGDIDSATAILENGLEQLPGEQTIREKLEEVRSLSRTTITLTQVRDSEMSEQTPHGRHPFAVALEQYIAEMDAQSARIFTNVQEDGVEVMIASDDSPVPYTSIRLFYIHGGELRTHDIEVRQAGAGYSFSISTNGYLVISGGDMHSWWWRIFGISSGEFRFICTLLNEYDFDENYEQRFERNYIVHTDRDFYERSSYSDTSWVDSATAISGTEYEGYRRDYGLDGMEFLHPQFEPTPGQIAEILMMTTSEPQAVAASPKSLTVSIGGTAADFEAYRIDDADYFSLRDIAAALSGTDKQLAISETTDKITLALGQPYTPTGNRAAHSGEAQTAIPAIFQTRIGGELQRFLSYSIYGEWCFTAADLEKLLGVSIEQTAPDIADTTDNTHLYADIISAFMRYEESGWTDYGSELIADSFLVTPQTHDGYTPSNWAASSVTMDYNINYISLRYSLYDINSDGQMELIIGAQEQYGDYRNPIVFGIYTVSEGEIVSLAQKWGPRDLLFIYENQTIMSGWYGNGACEEEWYLLTSENELRTVLHYEHWNYDFDNYGTIVKNDNGDTLTGEDAQEAYNQYNNAPTAQLEWHPLSRFFEN